MMAAVSATALVSVMGMDTAFAKTVLRGDLDGDGQVTLTDAQTALKGALRIVKLREGQETVADMDGDGQITLTDAQRILKCALRIEEAGTVEVSPTTPPTEKPEEGGNNPVTEEHTLPCIYFEGCEEYFANLGIPIVVKEVISSTFCYCGEPLDYDEYGNRLTEEERLVKDQNHYLEHFLNQDGIGGSVSYTSKVVFKQ